MQLELGTMILNFDEYTYSREQIQQFLEIRSLNLVMLNNDILIFWLIGSHKFVKYC